MDDEIGITPDRAGEMSIIRFGQSIMTERLRQITRPFQALEQTDFQRLFLWLAPERVEQAL